MFLTEVSQIQWKCGRFAYLTNKYCKLLSISLGLSGFVGVFKWAYLLGERNSLIEDIVEFQEQRAKKDSIELLTDNIAVGSNTI